MSKLNYCSPQCDIEEFVPGAYLLSASGESEIEQANATVYGDDFWSIGG